MTDQWNAGPGVQDTPAPDGRTRNERWLRRPRRSTGDRKIAGVAGGLGRAFGIDPVLIRVAFVVLTIFGGVGGLLYVLGWLLLPSDGDEVSAAEALLGRGRSSVPPALAVGLGIVAVISAFSMFSWGRPFLPLAIGGVIVLAIMRKRGRLGHHGPWSRAHSGWSGPNSGRPGANDDWMQRTDDQVRAWTEQAEQWASRTRHAARGGRQSGGRWQGGCGSRGSWGGWGAGSGPEGWRGSSNPGSTTSGASTDAPTNSPFERPAFWDQQPSSSSATGSSRVNMNKSDAPQQSASQSAFDTQVPVEEQAPRTTPPAWDPLGVAPFAWDLPEPTPLAQAPAAVRGGSGIIARVALGITLLVGGVTSVGVFAGWWALTWAQVSAIALGVLALGLLFSALRGRGYSLIGPGVFLSLVTLALSVTGISGTTGYGATQIHPASLAELQNTYSSNAGELTLDLSSISIPKGTTENVTVELKGGHADVVLPSTGLNVTATCQAEVGRADCLGQTSDGLRKEASGSLSGNPNSGTLHVDVKVNAGYAEVSTNA